MKVCLILEGNYPYIRSPFSDWVDAYIRQQSRTEFVLWTLSGGTREKRTAAYELPENVTGLEETWPCDLKAMCEARGKSLRGKQPDAVSRALTELIDGGRPDWSILYGLARQRQLTPKPFLEGRYYQNLAKTLFESKYPYAPFQELYFGSRDMCLPVLYLLQCEPPKADLYHSFASGYSGVLGVLGRYWYGSPFLMSEREIYEQKREEEVLCAQWLSAEMRKYWIRHLQMLAALAYQNADLVVAGNEEDRNAQVRFGSAPEESLIYAGSSLFQVNGKNTAVTFEDTDPMLHVYERLQAL